tara:strand:- start:18529 stop:19632 length:1104 start_codon:yes stop_codon:yes gene_type:complete
MGTFVDDPDDRQHVEKLSEWCEDVHAVVLSPRAARLGSLRGLLTGEALSLPYYRNEGLSAWIRDVVEHEHIRQAVAFSGPMAQYLDGLRLERRIIDFCDLDSAKWTQYAADHSWPMSWLYRREGRKLLSFERAAANVADASLFVTDAEAQLFRDAAPEVTQRIGVMQNGVNAEYFSPEHRFDNPYPDGSPVLLFTGAMDYWPNIDAVSWFVAEILPAIRAQLPNVSFWIVGMNPSPAVQALAGNGVTVTGTVADVRPYLAHADVVVAPLRIARGIQNKVLEAMAMARPVVLAAAPANGLEAESGHDCEIAHSADSFVSLILALLADAGTREAMGQAARARVLARYAWSAHLAVLDALLQNKNEQNPG